MQITVTGRHAGITDHAKDYAEKKVVRLDRYFDGVQSIDVIMDREGDQNTVELIISVSGSRLVSESLQADPYAAIDFALDKAETQLIRYKEKLKKKRSKQASASAEEEGIKGVGE